MTSSLARALTGVVRVACLVVAVEASAQYSPYASNQYPVRPYFGDEHVHTGWSADAGMAGATLTPEDAVRFARGEQVTSSTGQPVKLGRPLDWVAITDHSDGMGIISELRAGNPELTADPTLKRWRDMMLAGGDDAQKATSEMIAAQAKKQLPAPAQVIKGWLDKQGKPQEKIFDVAWTDAARRKPGPDGKVPPVGNTVDVATATWKNTIGGPELIALWKDPEFDPAAWAFYYARVLEIPTPRWTDYDAAYFKVQMGKEVPMTTQERAWTSPTWYTPATS